MIAYYLPRVKYIIPKDLYIKRGKFMKIFRKMDEMEMSINLMAIRWAWVYTGLFLLVWIFYDWIKAGWFNVIAFLLLVSQQLIYWSIQLFLKWKLGKDEK